MWGILLDRLLVAILLDVNYQYPYWFGISIFLIISWVITLILGREKKSSCLTIKYLTLLRKSRRGIRKNKIFLISRYCLFMLIFVVPVAIVGCFLIARLVALAPVMLCPAGLHY